MSNINQSGAYVPRPLFNLFTKGNLHPNVTGGQIDVEKVREELRSLNERGLQIAETLSQQMPDLIENERSIRENLTDADLIFEDDQETFGSPNRFNNVTRAPIVNVGDELSSLSESELMRAQTLSRFTLLPRSLSY